MKLITKPIHLLLLFLFLPLSRGIYANTSKELEVILQESKDILYLYPDSAINQLTLALTDVEQANHYLLKTKILLTLSVAHNVKLEYSQAFDYCGEAVFIAEEHKDTLLMAESYEKFGILNYLLYQKKESEEYLQKAITCAKHSIKAHKMPPHLLISYYFSLARSYRQFGMYDEGLPYLDSCYYVAQSLTPARENTAYLDGEKGVFFLHQNRIDEALTTLIKSRDYLLNVTETDDNKNSKAFLTIIYSYLGQAYYQLNNYPLAEKNYKLALEVLESNLRHIEQKPYILEHYGNLLYTTGQYQKAFLLQKEGNALNEKYYSTRASNNGNLLTVKNRYREELYNKNKELVEKKQTILRFRIFAVSILLIIVLAIFFFRNRIQTQRLTQEKNSRKKEEEEAALLLQHKNKELTTSTLKLIEKEAEIDSLCDHINSISDSHSSKVLLSSIKHNRSTLWDNFNTSFMDVNIDFYKNLNIKAPNLSPGDIKICALTKLNFSCKEMAHLLGISTESVHKARHRLRKKLNLEQDESLTAFIASI